MNRSFTRTILVTFSLACAGSLVSGCGEIAKMGLEGALQKVGATVVNGSSDEHLKDMFEKANGACPRRMDIFTTLEEVKMIDDRRVEFRYVVSDAGKKIVSRLNKQSMKKTAVEHMRGNAMAVAIAQRDLSVEHIYEDSAGKHLFSYTINRAVLDGDLDASGSQQSNPFDVAPVKATITDRRVDQDAKSNLEKQPRLPQDDGSSERATGHPAGIQTNPFFSGT